MLIGLAGLYCAGKNHVATLLEKRGFPVLNVDKLGHTVIENQKNAIINRFGEDVLNPDGSVNRRFLGAKVFGKADELTELEAIVHPEANRLLVEWIEGQQGKACVINTALLHKSIVFGCLDCIIFVNAPFCTRLIRAKRRDELPLTAIIKRLMSQKQFYAHYSSGNADIYRVENPGLGKPRVLPTLENRIDSILSTLGL